ncbi:O-antigen ligase family protein [Sphingomonas kyungheensis]|uniref:O-antigen ligase family protein n=1 Tax=Sphingomonas kyungheensis TaxID=1069987 RepID=A0ABU8H4G1_9SPHN
MKSQRLSSSRFRPTLSLGLFAMFLTVVWIAGGASRADVMGQAVVRGASWALLAITAVLAPRPRLGQVKPVMFFVTAAALLTALQLLPLPPSVWEAMPGRAILVEAATASGQTQPWRPWSIVPGATINALASLVIPFATLMLVSVMRKDEQDWLPAMMLVFISASMMIGLLQFSGAVLANPFINDTPGQTAGTLANRNHFALLMAIGCALAPVWAIQDEGRLQWRGPLASALVLLFLLAILGSGSRAGLGLGVAGVALGTVIIGKRLQRVMQRRSRWAFPALIALALCVIVALTIVGVSTGRSVSVGRLLATDLNQDMRSRGLPTVLAMIGNYLPFGTGFGSFDTLFRMHEPFALLKPTYFNHAHNDWLEIVLDGGVIGGLLLIVALVWWAWASARAWRSHASLPKFGSAAILLLMAASLFDYPARTPTFMMVLVLAAVWLNSGGTKGAPALPRDPLHL